MSEEEVLAVLEHRLSRLRRELHNMREHAGEEALHGFRLQVKKLRSLLRLLQVKPSKISIAEGMKKLYTLSGEVRNLQLHVKTIEAELLQLQLPLPERYFACLEKEKAGVQLQLYKALDTSSYHHFRKVLLQRVPTQLGAAHFSDYMERIRNHFYSLVLAPIHTDEGLHEVRKTCKEVSYNHRYLPSSILPLLPHWLKKKDATDAVTERLGNYHDLCVSLQYLSLAQVSQPGFRPEKWILVRVKESLLIRKLETKPKLVQCLQERVDS